MSTGWQLLIPSTHCKERPTVDAQSASDVLIRSDMVVQPPTTTYEQSSNFTTIRTPDRPDYWFGNYILLRKAPGAFDRVRLLDLWNAKFPGSDIEHVLYQWIEEKPRRPFSVLLAEGRKQTRAIDNVALITRTELRQTQRPNREYVLRFCEDPKDHKRLIRAAMSNYGSESDWAKWRYSKYLEKCAAGQGVWLMALQGRSLIGFAGLFWSGELFRFQDVWVAPAMRRRKVASTMCQFLVRVALEKAAKPTVVIVAERNSSAQSAYEKIGFESAAFQCGIMSKRDAFKA